MEKMWIGIRKNEDFKSLDEIFDDVENMRFGELDLDASIKYVYNPFRFKNMKTVAEKIIKALQDNVNVLVHGDYDVDGCTSVFTMFCSLSQIRDKLGSSSVISYYIPHRENEGYGLNCEALLKVKNAGFGLVITVDCGISNVKEVEYAKEIGLDVIVTDHHEIPKETPDTLIINCKDGSYPFDRLSGCGVAFKVLEAVHMLGNKINPAIERKNVYEYADILCISTIADMVELYGENRILVNYGLKVLNRNIKIRLRPWINAILEKANRIDKEVTSSTVAFQIAPRINSIGRLNHAMKALKFMLESDYLTALKMADAVEKLNEKRKALQQAAFSAVEQDILKNGANYNVVYAVDCPAGVVGLVAANVLEKYYLPATIFSKEDDKPFYKGSARSVEGVNYFTDVLEKNRDIIIKGGGHAGAAGLTVTRENLDVLRQRISTVVKAKLLENKLLLTPRIYYECELRPEDIDFYIADRISRLEPFGQKNPEPVFLMKDVRIAGDINRVPQDNPTLLQIPISKGMYQFRAIMFKNIERYDFFMSHSRFDILFNININEYRGKKSIQLVIVDAKPFEI